MNTAEDGLPLPQRYWAILNLAVGLALSVLDSAIANIALPAIAKEIHASPADSIWVINAYQLAVVISLLPFASLSILLGRMTTVLDRIRSLNEIAYEASARAHLKSDIPRLRRRAKLLNSATRLALASGMCTSLLLVVGFASAFLKLHHEYGAGVLFLFAVALLGGSLSLNSVRR